MGVSVIIILNEIQVLICRLSKVYCLSYIFIALIKLCDQGNLEEKEIWEAYTFRDKYMPIIAGCMAVGEAATVILHSYPQVGDRENSLRMMCFETTKPTPSDTPPSTRPCLLIFSKQFYQLGTKYSHMSVWAPFSFKPTQVPSKIGHLKTTDNIDVIAHKSSS